MGATQVVRESEQRFLTVDEAASYLGLPRWKVMELARNEALSSIKVHRLIRFDRADLDEFIRVHRRPAKTSAVRA